MIKCESFQLELASLDNPWSKDPGVALIDVKGEDPKERALPRAV